MLLHAKIGAPMPSHDRRRIRQEAREKLQGEDRKIKALEDIADGLIDLQSVLHQLHQDVQILASKK